MFLFTRSVDGVIASILRKIKQLEQIAHDKRQEAEDCRGEAEILLVDADSADAESMRANRLARKFTELVS